MIEIDNDSWYTVSEMSKIIALKGIGRNKMMLLLRINKVLMDNNFPYQFYQTMDMVRMHRIGRNGHTFYIPIFSEKALNFIEERFKNGHFQK
jgi:hypothetical protein